MNSKDLSLIIIMAVVQFIVSALIVQMGKVITGMRGVNNIFTIFLAVPICVSLLGYQGRKWRFFIQMSIFSLLIIPTHLGGTPFDPISRIGGVANALLWDFLANGIYGKFIKRNKLLWWAIILSVGYWVTHPLFSMIVKQIFFPPEILEAYVNILIFLYPIIIIESIAGGYIGYKIFKRFESTYQRKMIFKDS